MYMVKKFKDTKGKKSCMKRMCTKDLLSFAIRWDATQCPWLWESIKLTIVNNCNFCWVSLRDSSSAEKIPKLRYT
jgi:hypothetical protein